MTDKTLDREIGEVEKDLEAPVPDEPTPKPEKTKMATKKVVKKTGATPAKSAKTNGKATPAKTAKATKPAKADAEGMVKLSSLATEAKISTQRARQKLRAAELDRGDGRWSWKEGSRDLQAARKALGLT